MTDEKSELTAPLEALNGAVLAKLDGLGEYDLRRPLTPTGTNLLGLAKHFASVQLGYLGDVFGRPSGRVLPWLGPGSEINADMFATADETREEIVELFQFSSAHSDATVEALELDSVGSVPWWTPERRQVTLHQVLVHLMVDAARHAGHADIVRELIDGRAGNNDGNLPELTEAEWSAYHARVEQAAEEAARRGAPAG